MSKYSIKKFYSDKIKLLHKYNKFYYDKNKSIITDEDFDKLKKEILELEKNTYI